jgi:hypothetical protein
MSASKRLATTLLAAAFLCLPAISARAQEVLACYTLHNDLANFDRRAHSVDNYFLPQLRRETGAITPGELKNAWNRSYLGGQDIVRLRIIYEMRRFGCPISPEDEYWLQQYYRSRSDGKKVKRLDKIISLPIK